MTRLSTVHTVLGRFFLFGFAGWVLENVYAKIRSESPRYSAAFRGYRVPFLPVYGFGGTFLVTAVTSPAIAPRLLSLPTPIRAAIYGTSLTGLEYVACRLDRQAFGACSWNYNASPPSSAPSTTSAASSTASSATSSSSSASTASSATSSTTSMPPKPCDGDKGCIDRRHSLAWAALGLLLERATLMLTTTIAASPVEAR